MQERMIPLLQTQCWEGVLMLTVGYMVYYGIFKIPRVTLLVVVIQMLSFAEFFPDLWDCAGGPIPAQTILDRLSLWSLFALHLERKAHGLVFAPIIGGFIHVGAYLEPKFGSINFALLLGVLSLGISLFYVYYLVGWRDLSNMYSMVGFTAVLFALQTLMILDKYNPRLSDVEEEWDVFLPYILVIVYCIVVDRRSVFFHCAGIFVGILYTISSIGTLINKQITKYTGQEINFHTGPPM